VQLTRCRVLNRYRGFDLGLAWSFLNPLLMLVVYTFVFSVVFEARWWARMRRAKPISRSCCSLD